MHAESASEVMAQVKDLQTGRHAATSRCLTALVSQAAFASWQDALHAAAVPAVAQVLGYLQLFRRKDGVEVRLPPASDSCRLYEIVFWGDNSTYHC